MSGSALNFTVLASDFTMIGTWINQVVYKLNEVASSLDEVARNLHGAVIFSALSGIFRQMEPPLAAQRLPPAAERRCHCPRP